MKSGLWRGKEPEVFAVDPGWNVTGWAWFVNKKLEACGIVKVDGDLGDFIFNLQNVRADLSPIFAGAPCVVVEVPLIRPERVERAEPNDLMKLALVAGAAAAVMDSPANTRTVHPSSWKGGRPKKVDNPYTLGLLSKAESAIYKEAEAPASLRHNMIDAIGLGLWALRRR